ncbi:MAG: DnaA/Hda family protein, partial [Aquisalimonadaceae bacterium]
WEEAVFHLYNRVLEAGGRLLVSASGRPARLGISLPDLESRLSWGLVHRLQPLSESELLQALERRALARGLELPADTGRYLISRVPRDAGSLFSLLDRLDQAALAAQRRLTVPFVRRVLFRD